MASSLFGIRTRLELEHVPYRGGSAAVQVDLMAGRLDFIIGNLPALAAGLQSGGIRPLAVAYERRWPSLPDPPTMAEAGVAGVEVPNWHALLGPRGLPDAIRDRLAAKARTVLFAPAMRARLLDLGTGRSPPTRLGWRPGHWRNLRVTVTSSGASVSARIEGRAPGCRSAPWQP